MRDPTPPYLWRQPFLNVLSRTGNLSAAARAVGICKRTLQRNRRNDPVFDDQVREALDRAVDLLEEEAWRRARAGSDQVLIFLLKSLRPKKYQDVSRHEIAGPGGGPIPVKAYIGFDPSEWDGKSTNQDKYKVVEGVAVPVLESGDDDEDLDE